MSSSKFIKGMYVKDMYSGTVYKILKGCYSWEAKMYYNKYKYLSVISINDGDKWWVSEDRLIPIGYTLDEVMLEEL